MEVSLTPPPISQDFNDPIVLARQLENLREGHYSRRLHDYILKETEQLVNFISADPRVLPIREQLYDRIPTSGFVRNTLEQLGILQFEHEDLCRKLEDLDKLVEEADMKLKEFKNYGSTLTRRCLFLKYFFFCPRFARKLRIIKEITGLFYLYGKKEDQFRKLWDDFKSRAYRKFADLNTQAVQTDNIIGIDGVLRKHVMEFNVIPASRTNTESRLKRKKDKISGIITSYKHWCNDDALTHVDSVVLAFMLYFLCEKIIL